MNQSGPSLLACCFAETLGTFLLVFFGCGSVHAAVLTAAQVGLWQVAIVWGVAIMAAIYVVGGVSGAHINPAITLAMCAWRRFPLGHVLPYLASQCTGAFLAAGCLFYLYQPFLQERETALSLIRGYPGSEMTAMCYGEYFPNPGLLERAWREELAAPIAKGRDEILRHHRGFVTLPVAFAAEFLGTLILALVVFAVTDERNAAAPLGRTGPVFIGLTVAILISVIAPLTQACFNPARDYGPRTVAWLAGWNDVAWPGPAGWDGTLLVYGLAPVLGAVAGGALFRFGIEPAFPATPLENAP